MSRALALPACLALLLLCACAKSDYGMPGLSLPPGSEVVYESQSDAPPDSPVLPNGKKAKSITLVEFNNEQGWAQVSAHIDSFMQRAGYEDSVQKLNNMFPDVGKGIEVTSGMRMYTKDGAGFMVSLDNQLALFGSREALPQGSGEFMLAVTEFE